MVPCPVRNMRRQDVTQVLGNRFGAVHSCLARPRAVPQPSLPCPLASLNPPSLNPPPPAAATAAAAPQAKLDFSFEPWPSLSRDVKLLLRRMLVKDPRERASLEEVISHPWFAR